MEKYFAVKVDVSGKQEYIFSSNRLKEVVGASKIIEFVTEILGRVIIEEMKSDEILKYGLNQRKFTEVFDWKNSKGEIESIRGNVHIEGGGNAIYIFTKKEQAKNFTKRFTKYVLEHFEGLDITVVTEDFNMREDLGLELYSRLDNAINIKKNSVRRPLRSFSFGMYDKCGNTGKPIGYEVSEISDENSKEYVSKLVSKESYQKRLFYDEVIMNRYENSEDYNKIRIDSLEFNKDEKIYDDFYRIKKYMDSDKKSEIKDKITWMRSYYVSKEGNTLSKIIPQYYDKKTLLNTKEVDKINDLVLETRLKNIENIAGDNTIASYIGLTQLDGNGIGNALRNMPYYFAQELRRGFESRDNSAEESEYLKCIVNGRSVEVKGKFLGEVAKDLVEEHNKFFFKFQEVLSEEIQKVFETAFIKVLAKRAEKAKKMKESNNIDENHFKLMKSIVPIIMAGDDISFWSSGEFCIPISTEYIKEISEFKEMEEYENSNDLKSNILKRLEKDNSLSEKLTKTKTLEIYEEGLKSFKNMSVSGGTAITLISYPISQASKIAGKLESYSKGRGSEFDTSEMYPSIYDWEIVRGEFSELGKRRYKNEKKCIVCNENNRICKPNNENKCRPYVIKYDEQSEADFKEFTETVNELYKIKKEDDPNNRKDSKTSTVNKFREFMNDENQAKLTAYRNNSKSDGILYDAIEIWGLNCKFDNEIEQNKDEKGEA